MARPLRIVFPGATYHIFSRGNRKDPIFFSDRDYRVFLKKLDETLSKYGCVCYTFCLMPNHYHVYLKTPLPNVSEAIHYLNAGYSNWLKTKYKIVGHVFQGRFGSILIDDATYAVFLSSYIHLNPVRAGICVRPHDYPWSSYETMCRRRSSPIRHFDSGFVLGFLHRDLVAAVSLYEEYVERMRKAGKGLPALTQRAFLGSDEFARKIRAEFNEGGNRREFSRCLRGRVAPPTTEAIRQAVRSAFCETLTSLKGVLPESVSACESPGHGESQTSTPGPSSGLPTGLERRIIIYLEKRYSEQTLAQIGLRWGLDYAAVAQIVRRLETSRGRDRLLASILTRAEERLRGSGLYENS